MAAARTACMGLPHITSRPHQLANNPTALPPYPRLCIHSTGWSRASLAEAVAFGPRVARVACCTCSSGLVSPPRHHRCLVHKMMGLPLDVCTLKHTHFKAA